ncbi:hypothetical protein MXB_3381 [Myxobolus squamalis]|nr:hypothetical protein MXB_3381 [Myxobolus squamalis]
MFSPAVGYVPIAKYVKFVSLIMIKPFNVAFSVIRDSINIVPQLHCSLFLMKNCVTSVILAYIYLELINDLLVKILHFVFQVRNRNTQKRRRLLRIPRVKKSKMRSIQPHTDAEDSILTSTSLFQPPDMLENLLKSNKFLDITENDISIYRTIHDVVVSQIPKANPSTDLKFCTPPYIQLGKYEIKSWYSSPYPLEYATVCKLHICEFCLEYRKTSSIMQRHLTMCKARHPPDREIYRSSNLSIFEIDGQNYKNYCQNICLIAKLFLDHKTLYYDVEPFLFYVLTFNDETGCHLVGYFSKYTFFLLMLGYLLTREEGLTGSPEKPLSTLGKLSYNAYWNCAVCAYLSQHLNDNLISIKRALVHILILEIMQHTGMDPHDVASTLQRLGLIRITKEKKVIITLKLQVVQKCLSTNSYIKRIILDETKLRWAPFIKPSSHSEFPVEIANIQSDQLNGNNHVKVYKNIQ